MNRSASSQTRSLESTEPQEDEHEGDDEKRLDALRTEEVLDVQAGEQVPPENGREGEEEQADGHESVAEARAEEPAEGELRHVRLVEAGGKAGRVEGERPVFDVEHRDDNSVTTTSTIVKQIGRAHV